MNPEACLRLRATTWLALRGKPAFGIRLAGVDLHLGVNPETMAPMNDRRVPVPKKWPFYVADAICLAFAIWILNHYPHPLSFGVTCLMATAVFLAAFLGVMPFRMEHQAAVRFAEAEGLADAMVTLRKLETVSDQIKTATGQWQGIQEQSGRAVASSKEIADRIAAEAHSFAEFMQKANDAEKATLRLETEKLRRGEGQWLQVLVHMLDHVYALYQAGARSGQPNLQAQLANFQEACRDIARRVGLMPFEPNPNEAFDAEKHQVADDQPAPAPDARIAQALATGYTFQGRLLRRSLVAVVADTPVDASALSDELAPATATPGLESTSAEDSEMLDSASSYEEQGQEENSAFASEEELTVTATDAQASPRAAMEVEQEFRLESEPFEAGQGDDVRRP